MPEPQAGTGSRDGQGDGGQGPAPFDFDAWVASQPTDVQAAIEAGTKGLKSSLNGAREDAKQARDALKTAAETATGEMKAQLEQAQRDAAGLERKATFVDEAVQQRCKKPGALWTLAVAAEAFDRNGKPDWKYLRSEYPELFESEAAPRGNAGSGTGTPPANKPDMEAMLRRAAGRG